MYNTVLRIVSDAYLADDVVQEGFIKAFDKLETYRAEASFGSWLKRIMVNTALNTLKKKKLELANLEVVENTADPETHLEVSYWKETPSVEHLNQLIQELPKGCRVIFTLYQLEGYEQKEVAEIVGISLSTVKTQYKRAKELLRQQLTA